MAILVLMTFLVIVVFFANALRIPALKINATASETEKLNTLDNWLSKLHQKNKFNGVVLLASDEAVIFSKSYGCTDLTASHALSEHFSFNLASVSKQFTAMGVVLLKAQGKIAYQDKLAAYIPELDCYPNIRIHHLLHHTSGIPDYMQLASKYEKKAEILTVSKMISLYRNYQPALKFIPGEKFSYSNTGYVLLAEIVGRVSGLSFEDFMAKNIFLPLNMKNTQVFNRCSEDPPKHRVYGYQRRFGIFGGKKQAKDLNYFDGVVGDGGIYASAYDLFLWHQALTHGTLVSNKMYQQAYIPAQLNHGSSTQYGFGWVVNHDNTVEHAGGWQGFGTFIHRNLNNKNLIVILDNSTNAIRVTPIGFRFNSIGLNVKYFMKNF